MTPPAAPLPKVRSSPGAVSDGDVSTTPLVVQLAALDQVTLSPAVPMAAPPSNVAGAAGAATGRESVAKAAATAAERADARFRPRRERSICIFSESPRPPAGGREPPRDQGLRGS